jgi:hypothetical protein
MLVHIHIAVGTAEVPETLANHGACDSFAGTFTVAYIAPSRDPLSVGRNTSTTCAQVIRTSLKEASKLVSLRPVILSRTAFSF